MRPSALAVFMLISGSNLVGCSTGRSEGLVPFRDLIDVTACAAEQIGYIGAVDRQSATIGVVSEEVVCRQMILRRERDNSRSLDKGEDRQGQL
jgi:hypothetical protein